jgi:hypothetical protein
MKSQGFFQTPQDIMEEYNGCSVPQYTRYGKIGNVRKEGLSIPVRALSSLLMIFVLTPTLEFHSDC